MEEKIKLSGRELDVMNVLWEADRSLIAKDIIELNPLLSINTVQSVLKALLKKNYIKIAGIVYSGTVLTRSYMPVLSVDEYMINLMTKGMNKQVSTVGIMAALLKKEKNEEQTIEKLEKMLEEYKKNIKKEK